MSQEDADPPSATPLDLLINAISGSTEYMYPFPPADNLRETSVITPILQDERNEPTPNLEGYLSNKAATSHNGQKRRDRDDSLTTAQREIAKTITEQIVESYANVSSLPSNIPRNDTRATTIEIWHPTTGQKSYGKERRIIAPPPKLCISGPLLPSITSVTLSTTTLSLSLTPTVTVSSSQTHLISSSEESFSDTFGLGNSTEVNSRGKKGEKLDQKKKLRDLARNAGFGATLPKIRSNIEGKDRELLLDDGLNFPGLWIGEDVGKNKEFTLELKVDIGNDQQSDDSNNNKSPSEIPTTDKQTENIVIETPQQEEQIIEEPFQGMNDPPSFSEVLDPSSMEVLQPLAEAVQQVNEATKDTLAEHLPEGQDSSSADHAQRTAATITGETTTQTFAGITQNIDPILSDKKPTKPYITFNSTPLKIVSKPSTKTAKARSISSCFSINSSFALWTRINAQTVRTKYMKLEFDAVEIKEDNAKLTSKTGKWTPFKFEIITRAIPSSVESGKKIKSNNSNQNLETDISKSSNSKIIEENEEILTYGSIVRLVDLQSGLKSDPIKIVKIEDCEYKLDENVGHPISELQRIGLIKLNNDLTEYLNDDQKRWYLSAPGARLGGGELISPNNGKGGRAKPTPKPKVSIITTPQPIPEDVAIPPPETLDSVENTLPKSDSPTPQATRVRESEEDNTNAEPPKKKKKTKRNALASAVIAEDEDGGLQTVLSWIKADNEERSIQIQGENEEEDKKVVVDRVDEWMSWIIGGVSCSSQTFFSTSTTATVNERSKTIDPIPRILSPLTFDSEQNTLDLTLSQFHFPSLPPTSSASSASSLKQEEALDVYLGPIGPLHTTEWRSTSFKNTPKEAIPFNPPQPDNPNQESDGEYRVISSYPANKKHIIVQIHMPHADEILEVMQDCLNRVKELKTTAKTDQIVELDNHDDVPQTKTLDIENETITTDKDTQEVEGTTDNNNINVDPIVSTETSWLGENATVQGELSIAAALEMTSSEFDTLNNLESFSEPQSQIQDQVENENQITELKKQTLREEESLIDPSLRELSDVIQEKEVHNLDNQMQAVPQIPQPIQNVTQSQDTIRLYKSENTNGNNEKSELIPLPFILIRKSDGMGFGIGKQIIAQKIDKSNSSHRSEEHRREGGSSLENVKWGLKVVDI